MTTYQLTLPCFFINDFDDDLEKINFHVKADDYFATLATVLDLMQQEQLNPEIDHSKILTQLKEELLILQKKYRIIKK